MSKFLLLPLFLLSFFKLNAQSIQFTPFDKFCVGEPLIVLDSYVNLSSGNWELISINDSLSGTSEYTSVVANMLDSTKINTGYPGKYFWKYTHPNSGNPLKDSVYMTLGGLPDLSSVRNPYPKCFDDGLFDLDAESPIGANFKWSQKDSSSIWYTMVDKRRDTMISKDTNTPHWYYTNRFFDASKNQNYIPSPRIDKVRIHVRQNQTGCEDSAEFNVRINPNPVVILKDITVCQDVEAFRVNSALVLAPSNPDGGRYTWKIDSAPTGISQMEFDSLLVEQVDSSNKPFLFNYIAFKPKALNKDPKDPPRGIGTYKLLFCYEDGSTNCRTCDSAYITVKALPDIQFKPFDKFCYSDDTVQLDSYINLSNGKWELKSFNSISSGPIFNNALAKMIDSTAININDPNGSGGTYCWRYLNMRTGCLVKDSICMDVSAQPRLSFHIDDTICFAEPLYNLTPYTTTDLPFSSGAAGTGFYGNGVNGNNFDPKAVPTASFKYSSHKVYSKYVHHVTLCYNIDSSEIYIENEYQFNKNIYQSNNTITSFESNALYKWFDCDSNKVIVGETNKSFNPSREGNYKVLFTYGDCSTGESNCYNYRKVEINSIAEGSIKIYPNPVYDKISIQSLNAKVKISQVSILSSSGQKVWSGNSIINIPFNQPAGVYLIKIETGNGVVVKKVVK